jgi:hypothetical protein
MEFKRCPDCNDVKPKTEEYFCTRAKNRKRYFASCKSCNREHAAKWYANNKERAAKKERARKRSPRSPEQKARINAARRLRRKQLARHKPMITEQGRLYMRLYVRSRYRKSFRLRFVINFQVRSRLRTRKYLPRSTEKFVERFGYEAACSTSRAAALKTHELEQLRGCMGNRPHHPRRSVQAPRTDTGVLGAGEPAPPLGRPQFREERPAHIPDLGRELINRNGATRRG